jgi:hypothetical protein
MIEKSSGLSNLQRRYFIQLTETPKIPFTHPIASALGARSAVSCPQSHCINASYEASTPGSTTVETGGDIGPGVCQRLISVCILNGNPENQCDEEDDQAVLHQALTLFLDYQPL